MKPQANGRLTSALICACACALLTALACGRSVAVKMSEPPPPADSSVSSAKSGADEERVARKVKDAVLEYCRRGRAPVSAKEAVGAMAGVVGERCIDAAGEVQTRGHTFVVGQRMFSDKINELLTGDIGTDDIEEMPAESVFGMLRDELASGGFGRENFPPLQEIFGGFAGRIGRPEDWGKVPLSLPEKYWPGRLPLRVNFDTRAGVDAAVSEIKDDRRRVLRVCTLALALTLKDEKLADRLDPSSALTLALETVNGMAKTAPMTDKAIDNPTREMREAQHQVIRLEPR